MALRKIGGLYVRGTGFSQEQLDGYRKDYDRLMRWIAGERPTPEEDAAAIARAEASERAFQRFDKTPRKTPRSKR